MGEQSGLMLGGFTEVHLCGRIETGASCGLCIQDPGQEQRPEGPSYLYHLLGC